MANATTTAKSSGARYGADIRKRALALARKGEPVAQISAKLGPSEKTIRNWMAEAEIPRSGVRRRYDRNAILRDVRKGRMSTTEICAKYGCSRKFVSHIKNGHLEP